MKGIQIPGLEAAPKVQVETLSILFDGLWESYLAGPGSSLNRQEAAWVTCQEAGSSEKPENRE